MKTGLSAPVWCNVLQHQVKSTILHYSAPVGQGPTLFFSNQHLREGVGCFCSQTQVSDTWQARCDLGTLPLCPVAVRAPVPGSPTEPLARWIPDNDTLGTYFNDLTDKVLDLEIGEVGSFLISISSATFSQTISFFFVVVAGQGGKPVSHYLVVHWPPPRPWSQLGPQAPQQYKY